MKEDSLPFNAQAIREAAALITSNPVARAEWEKLGPPPDGVCSYCWAYNQLRNILEGLPHGACEERLRGQEADGEELATSLEESLLGEIERLRLERNEARARLDRIAGAHAKKVGTGGLTDGTCIECGEVDPCPTYVWATTEGRDPVLNTWDPADDPGPGSVL